VAQIVEYFPRKHEAQVLLPTPKKESLIMLPQECEIALLPATEPGMRPCGERCSWPPLLHTVQFVTGDLPSSGCTVVRPESILLVEPGLHGVLTLLSLPGGGHTVPHFGLPMPGDQPVHFIVIPHKNPLFLSR
jgi:hypothetical protein